MLQYEKQENKQEQSMVMNFSKKTSRDMPKRNFAVMNDLRVQPRPIQMVAPSAANQMVIQRTPYDEYYKILSSRAELEKNELMIKLLGAIGTYIDFRNKNVPAGSSSSSSSSSSSVSSETTAELLNQAYNISQLAKEALSAAKRYPDLANTLRSLVKFAHVELPESKKMSMDNLVDILTRVRVSQGDKMGQRIRELGLLSVSNQEKKQRMVLMINGGKNPDGTAGSVAAPSEKDAAFKEWNEIRFIAHTHPNEPMYQGSNEFDLDKEAAEENRVEMVRRDNLPGGVGGTIFYSRDGILNKQGMNGKYTAELEIRQDTLRTIANECTKDLKNSAIKKGALEADFETWEEKYINSIESKVQERDSLMEQLKAQSLTAEQFIEKEQSLKEMQAKVPRIFRKVALQEDMAMTYWKEHPELSNEQDDETWLSFL